MSKLTNPAVQEAQRKQARKDARLTREVITTLMSTVAGRRWVWLELEDAQLFTATTTTDPYQAIFANGKRVSGLRLMNAVTSIAPAMYIRMTQENSSVDFEEQKNDDRDTDTLLL